MAPPLGRADIIKLRTRGELITHWSDYCNVAYDMAYSHQGQMRGTFVNTADRRSSRCVSHV
jgi:hypothetical protein